jgi:hypothetical protein
MPRDPDESHDAVEHVDDFTVRHGHDVRSDSETGPRNAGVGMVDHRVVSLTPYSRLLDEDARQLIWRRVWQSLPSSLASVQKI